MGNSGMSIERAKGIIGRLAADNGISAWKVTETQTCANELFFVRKELDMFRAKDVRHIGLIVYKDFDENGTKFRGSYKAQIMPSMCDHDVEAVIRGAAFAAGYVKNPYYPLPKPAGMKGGAVFDHDCDSLRYTTHGIIACDSTHNTMREAIPDRLRLLAEYAYRPDNNANGYISASEFFYNIIQTRIINSEGIDVSFESCRGEIEYIINWNESGEEVEVYDNIGFSDLKPEVLEKRVQETISLSRQRAVAVPTPSLGSCTVLLTGSPAAEFFRYYNVHANVKSVYEKISAAKPGESVQGVAQGDRLTMRLDPMLENSPLSAPYDEDGLVLVPQVIIEDGMLKKYWGSVQYSHYLDIEPTGDIRNFAVGGGSKKEDEMKASSQPYLEIPAFSAFDMDDLTGDFAGEIRLGWHHDGDKRVPVTGGSISGNIRDVQENMYFSKELQARGNFSGPKTVQLFRVAIAGN